MPSRPRFQRSHLEPPTVALTPGLMARMADPGLDPEAALLAKEQLQDDAPELPARETLRLALLYPGDALALSWWTLGLTMGEVGSWLGVNKQRVHQRIRRGMARLREAGLGG